MPAATAPQRLVKVLVHSIFRETMARTGIQYHKNDKTGNYDQVNIFRKFHEHKAWMTPKEAAFLIDSDENQQRIEQGVGAAYFYPAGAPLPVQVSAKDPLDAPLTEAGLTTVDPRQARAAEKANAAKAAAIGKLMSGEATPEDVKVAKARPTTAADEG